MDNFSLGLCLESNSSSSNSDNTTANKFVMGEEPRRKLA